LGHALLASIVDNSLGSDNKPSTAADNLVNTHQTLRTGILDFLNSTLGTQQAGEPLKNLVNNK